MKTLILAEKPSQAMDYAKALGQRFERGDGFAESDTYIVTWAVGHLIELVEPDEYNPNWKNWNYEDLPMLPEKFKYKPTKHGAKQYKVVKKLVQRNDIEKVVIATDAGREGELIARLILDQAGNKHNTFRLWLSSLTKESIQEGFKNLKPGSDYDRLYISAMARQQSDWLIGLNATRAFTTKLGAMFSLGRVQTPVLAMIARRDDQITNFVPEDFWVVKAAFDVDGKTFDGSWIGSKDQPQKADNADDAADESEDGSDEAKKEKADGTKVKSKDEAQEICERVLAAGKGEVELCERKLKKEAPKPLFSLTTLQKEANTKLGYTADKTLQLAQSLYESRKALSYPRSEAMHLDPGMAGEVLDIVKKLPNITDVKFEVEKTTVSKGNRRVFDASKLTDHHALIPTGQIEGVLTPDEKALYEIVVKRFIAAFYPDYEYEHTKIITIVGNDRFRSTGKVPKVIGWKEIYGQESSKAKESDSTDEQELPQLSKEQEVSVADCKHQEKQTKPPAHYTDSSLLADMENPRKFVTSEKLKKVLKETSGLGTAATRAEIIKTIEKREYVKRRGKQIVVTPKGKALIEHVGNELIADPAYTAAWEQHLDGIANGEHSSSDDFIDKVKKYTAEIVRKAGTLNRLTGEAAGKKEVSIGKCPDCGKAVVERAKSYSCSGYPDCKMALWKDCMKRFKKDNITMTQARMLLDGKEIQFKGLVGKSGKPFDAKGKLGKHDKFGWQIDLVFESK